MTAERENNWPYVLTPLILGAVVLALCLWPESESAQPSSPHARAIPVHCRECYAHIEYPLCWQCRKEHDDR